MRITFLLIIFIYGIIAQAQNNSVGNNEKLVFTASYNMSGILTDLAEVNMETSEAKTSSATLLQLKITAVTYSKWDGFFKIRDLYESYVNPNNLIPYLYKRDIDEGGYKKTVKYTYNQKTNTVKSVQTRRGSNEETKNLTIHSGTKDIVSTIYNLRLIDFKNMAVGTKKTFTILFDRKEIKGQFTYLGKETITTAIGKKECYKLAVGSTQTDVLKGTNSNFLWLTADDNKIPLYGKFKIPVGTGELKIKSVSGLKN